MKKVFVIFCLIITFFIIYFLQANFFSWFTIASIKPNLFIIFVLLIGLFAGKKIGVILGLLFGIYLDLLIGRTIGISGILLATIGFSKESRLTIMLMVVGCTIAYELIGYVYHTFRLSLHFEINSFIRIVLIEALYNAILVIIIYPLMQKAGYAIENTFKVKSILTRYF